MIREFDIRGQICPSALLVTLREVNTMYTGLQEGSVLHVLTDSRKATDTIPSAVVNMGLKAEILPLQGYYQITISRAD